MEAQEEVVGSSKEQTHIVKGKRTKRQRPQSPVPLAITTNSSSGDTDTNINTNTNPILSPTTSAHEFIHDSTEEEEDMANCLILLAQGQSPLKKIEDGIYKFNSRRYIQDASDNGKASGGLCVYECKTCSRTFPSFQALGGHRASHKKLKVMAEDQNKKQFVLSDEEAEGVSKNHYLSLPQPPPLSLQLGNIKGNLHSNNNNNKANKVHECSVCGAEFTSGQALGGHMRRHRGPLMATNTSLSLTTNLALEPEEESEAKKSTRNLLSLDLNLPAPEDDHHHRESKFAFTAATSKQQQQQQQQQSPALVFSAAPALVDCHY